MKQKVKIGNILSDCFFVSSGVPQGSVLGPILFLIYIDDMHEIPEFSKLFCFADDAKLVCQKDSCVKSVQHDLCALRLWSYCNSLSFNIQKCGYLHFNRTSTDALFIGNDQLSWLERVRDLGVEVSCSLKWGAHLKIKFVKACRALNYLKHSVPSNLSSGVKFNLYKACAISVL